jgi:hypothetical protein
MYDPEKNSFYKFIGQDPVGTYKRENNIFCIDLFYDRRLLKMQKIGNTD